MVLNCLTKLRRVLAVAHRRPEVQSIAYDSPRSYIQVLVAVVVQVARYGSAAVAFRKCRARVLSHIVEVAVSFVSVQQIAVPLVRCNVEVAIAVSVIVKYHYGGTIVGYLKSIS